MLPDVNDGIISRLVGIPANELKFPFELFFVGVFLQTSTGLLCGVEGFSSSRLGISNEQSGAASESPELDSSSPDSQYGTRLAVELAAVDTLGSCS